MPGRSRLAALRRRGEAQPRQSDAKQCAAPLVQEIAERFEAFVRNRLCDLGGRVAGALERVSEVSVGALRAVGRAQSEYRFAGYVEPVLQVVQLVGDVIGVVHVRVARDRVEARQRSNDIRPQLSQLEGVPLLGAGDRPHPAIVSLGCPAMSGQAASVLVVDDDSGLRTLSRVVLQLEGFDVREAASLQEAEAALAERRPDVVLLDVHLGMEKSESLFARLRADGIPVAAVTGTADLRDVRGWADETLAKPYDPADLVAMARRLARVDAE